MSSEFWEAQSDCINDGTPYDINTSSTPADDVTDVNSCRMEFFFYFLL